jgi:hypothetical protein
MGYNFFDQYSFLHFAWGIIAYHAGITLEYWFVIHSLFEIIKNSESGMYLINTYGNEW